MLFRSFPAKYQKALFICDWTFGTMYAIHMAPHGSSYRATKEEFVSRTPLPLTDCTVGKDGALYFTIGGRGAQSELFRVTYVGKEDVSPVDATDRSRDPRVKLQPSDFRAIRHRIEKYHTGSWVPRGETDEIKQVINELGSEERQISTAARVALERVFPVSTWSGEVFAAPDKISKADPRHAMNPMYRSIAINGCVALARQSEPEYLPQIVATLSKLDVSQMSEFEQLGLLRAYQLAFIRLGNPDKETCAALAKKFDEIGRAHV